MPASWHAPYDLLKPQTRDMSRAIHSLMEELEAIDWYTQRVDVSDDEDLKRILSHHADEEKEHAAMLIEWIRRRDPAWDEMLRTYLFTTSDILEVEEGGPAEGPAPAVSEVPVASEAPSAREGPAEPYFEPLPLLTVGSLRPKR